MIFSLGTPSPQVEKFLKKRHTLRKRYEEAIAKVTEDPMNPAFIDHLKGRLLCLYKYRVGDFRIIFERDDNARVVIPIEVWSRGEAYKQRKV